jgi:transposase
MQKLERITDVETLQQVASHLEKTTVRQSKEIAKLRVENARLRGQAVNPQMEFELLKEQLAAMQKKLFGTSSEKRPGNADAPKDNKKKPPRGHGPRSQPNLPIEVVIHDLPEDDRTCTICGRQIEEMGDQIEESEEITVVGIEYKVVKHQRKKYRCRCNEQVKTAPGPDKLIPGGRYSVELAVHVAENKYLDHLPLERQVRAMERRGFRIDSQTLWDQIETLGNHLRPTYEALLQKVLKNHVVLADETRWKLTAKSDKTSKWWVWCVVSDEIAAYRILSHRSTKAAEQILGGFKGVVMTDGYGAYQALAREGPDITLAHCWAHVRRKFLEAEDAYPELSQYAVDLIGKLFEVERDTPKLRTGMPKDEVDEALALRTELRNKRSRPVIKQLLEWALEHRGTVLPKSKMGRAIEYMLNLWEGLTRFLDDPRVPLDNNGAERALRGVVVGRKNHYGSRSKRGTEVAALFYTLFETAKLSGVNPQAFVLEAAKRAIRKPGTVTLPADLT